MNPRTLGSTVRRMAIVAALGTLAVALLAGATGARASTVAGRVTGAPIPAAGTGAAFVRAVSLQTGEIADVDDTDAAGRYGLFVPKGAFALIPTVVTLNAVVSPPPTRVRLKKGQRKAVKLRARQNAVALRPVFALPDSSFRGGTGEFAALNKGLRDMLITDLLPARTATCKPVFVERSAQFAKAYDLELALTRRGLVDPATAIRPGHLTQPTRGIRGTISVRGGRMRITAEVYKWSSRKTLNRTSVEGLAKDFFRLEPVLARRLAALLCAPPPPVGGTFSGTLDYAQVTPKGVLIGTLDWNGSLALEPIPSPGGLPPQLGGPTSVFTARSGTVTVSLRVVAVTGGCTISGQGTFDVTDDILQGGSIPVLSVTEGDPDTYRLALDGGLAKVPTVLSACPPGDEGSNGRTGVWPLRGIGLLPFSTTPPVAAEGVFAGSAGASMPGLDDGYRWTWSLRG